jgi:hypothetical protein
MRRRRLRQVIFVITTDQDRDTFDAAWFTGLSKDFCPACKDAFPNQAAIVDEEQRMAAIASGGNVRPIRPLTFTLVPEEEVSTNGNAAA